MYKIQRVHQLAKALQNQENVILTRNGEWKARGGLVNGLQSLLGLQDNRRLAFAKSFVKALDELEVIPVRFSGDSKMPEDQVVDFKGYLEAGSALLPLLDKFSAPEAKELRLRLQERLVGLQYRLEVTNGGLDSAEPSEELFLQLGQWAAEWKSQQNAFYGSELEFDDARRLHDASRHPAFVELLANDLHMREEFFQWTIRDRVDVETFIQFPALREKLFQAYLTARIGRFGGNALRIQKLMEASGSRKVVTLPFEGHDISILDDQRAVTLRGNYRLTIKQAFSVFAAKMERVGDLEFFSNGINNWNSHLLGWWDADAKEYHLIDLNRAAWWKELPVLEVINQQEAKDRYGDNLDGKQWTLGVNATRTTRTLNPDASHAFVEVVVPMNDAKYAVYAMGKFATTYAGSMFDSLKLFTATLRATVAYPDENIFYTHREHVRRNFSMTPAEGMRYLESIRQDILKARDGNFTYQIESENCAKWIQDKMEEQFGKERVGNLFRIAMLDTEPPGAASSLFALLRQLPRDLHSPVLSFLHYMIGAWRGIWVLENGERKWVSVTTTQFWQDKVCYIPAVLHTDLQEQLVPLPAYATISGASAAAHQAVREDYLVAA
ncbi:MAG: hypothetical protein Q8K75_08135 [Chlamydiales bacterium]|nr:hypothetical protein [Chlamydiales bacterium]